MALTLNSSPLAIARAYESQEDRTDSEECPECGEYALETESGGSRRGRWYKVECGECDYSHDDVDIYD